MTQTQERETVVPATARAEQTLMRAGKQLGRLAGQTALRFRQAAQALHEEADQLDMPDSERQKPQTSPAQAGQPTLERAEALVDQFGQRVAAWTLGSNQSLQRTVARLREDVEDMWVEAQAMHKEWQDKRGHMGNEAG